MLIIMAVLGIAIISIILLDTFETVVLPRRIVKPLRLSRVFYWLSWKPWSAIGRRRRNPENFLAVFGPLSVLVLLSLWAAALVFGFALLHKAAASDLEGSLWHYLYFSGSTFFTLGLGDVVPVTALDRMVTVAEAATGFSFLALVIGYLPVFYQAFSQRERHIALLDSRAGSPPSAVEFLRRHCKNGKTANLDQFFIDWEHWAAELLESHLSYPSIGFFRSQHENESWVAALTMVLDVSALIIATFDDTVAHSANLTFAIARHAAVDLSQVYNIPPKALIRNRLLPTALAQMREILGSSAAVSEVRLAGQRALYEPYVNALADALLMPLPNWTVTERKLDNWQTTAWSDIDGAAGLT